MYEKLTMKIDQLFENAPKTRRAKELKEELLANIIDRYNDLIEKGRSEAEAINISINGIGDVDELIKGLKEQDVFNYEEIKKDRKNSSGNVISNWAIYNERGGSNIVDFCFKCR